MSRERRCWSYRECPYTKFRMLPYAKRLPHEEGVPMRLLFNVGLRAGRLRRRLRLVARLSAASPSGGKVRRQHGPRLRGVGAFLGTSQSAGRAIHWSSCSKRPHSVNAEAAACPRNVRRHFEEPLKLICAVRFQARTSGRTACTQRLNRRYATGKSDVFSDKRRSKSPLAGADRGERAGNPWPARA